jgi:MFS family permease
VLRSAGATPDWLGLWLPGACLTGIGIGLAFPTLGSAAVRDVPEDRFATASAVNAAFRQVGAVLGTAILVAMVGEPAGLQEALSSADSAYLFSAFAALASGAAVLGLRRQRAPGARGVGEGHAEAVVAGADLNRLAAHRPD